MCVSVALAIFLEQKYRWAARISGSVIALILAMVMANIGILPIQLKGDQLVQIDVSLPDLDLGQGAAGQIHAPDLEH